MRIFYRRPLSLILCIMLGAFSLFAKINETFRLILASFAVILLIFSFIEPFRNKMPRALVRTSVITFLIASLFSHLYFNLYFKAYERFQGEVSFCGTVTEIQDNDYFTYLTVKTENINSEPNSKYKLLVKLDFEEKRDFEFKIGNTVEIIGKIGNFESKNSNFDANSYYLSKGYSAKITEPTYLAVSGEETKPFLSFFTEMKHKATEFIVKNSDEESGGLLASLLLGEKTYLSPAIKLDFKRIGISHILALSGLHLAILALGFAKLLTILGIGKKLASLSTIIFTLAYMALTGFPISVVRAGLMLIISMLLYLFANATDSLTNLLISVFIIVFVSPYSIYDVSLLLSALATFGIVSLSELPKTYGKNKSIKNKVLNSLTVSLFALSATFLVSVLSFGEISVLSPVSTLIFAVIVEIFLYFGTFFLIFGAILPLGKILIFFTSIIKELAESFSALRYITLSTNFSFITVLAVIFTIIFFTFLVINVKHRRLGVVIISSLMSLILIIGILATYISENTYRVIYQRSNSGDSVLISDNGKISLIDYKTYMPNSIYETEECLRNQNLSLLHNYILCDYNSKMPEAVYDLLTDVKISNIFVPKPAGDKETDIFSKLIKLKETFNVNIYTYESDEKVDFETFVFTTKYRKDSNAIFEISHKNEKYLIASSGILDSDAKYLALEELNCADFIIFSRHGKSYRNYNFVYEFKNAKLIIASSKGMYVSDYMLTYYKNSGVEFYLTPEEYDFIR